MDTNPTYGNRRIANGAKSNVKANDVLTIKQAFSIPKSADSYRYDILFINGPQCGMKF